MNVTYIASLDEIELGSGHVAFSPLLSSSPNELFDFIKNQAVGKHQGRLTVVFHDIETHDVFFNELDSFFPDDERA